MHEAVEWSWNHDLQCGHQITFVTKPNMIQKVATGHKTLRIKTAVEI
jgi:hypothetical protein